jgi:hypothetical protein
MYAKTTPSMLLSLVLESKRECHAEGNERRPKPWSLWICRGFCGARAPRGRRAATTIRRTLASGRCAASAQVVPARRTLRGGEVIGAFPKRADAPRQQAVRPARLCCCRACAYRDAALAAVRGRASTSPRHAAWAPGLLNNTKIDFPPVELPMPVDDSEPIAGQEKFVALLFWFFWMLFGTIIVVDLILALMH